MEKPVRTSDDQRMPLAATLALGGLAAFGALTLVSWLIGAVFAIARVIIAIVVVVALIGWVAGRRLDRR